MILQSLEPSSVFKTLAALTAGNWLARVNIQDSAGSTSPTEQIMLFTVTQSSAALTKRGLFRRAGNVADPAATFENELEFLQNSSATFASSQVLDDALLDIGLGILALPTDVSESTGATALQEELVKFLSSVVASGSWILDPTANAPHAASLLKGIVGSVWNIPPSLSGDIYDLAEVMVTSAGDLVSSNCYDYATASSFTTAFDAVLTSITINKVHSAKIAKVYSALEKINSCQFVGMVCGQSPFTYNGNSIIETVGIVGATSTQDYCSSFTVTEGSQSCTRYACSELAGDSILDANLAETSGVAGIDRSKISSLSLVNAATLAAITSPNLSWTAKFGTSFINDYGTSEYGANAAVLSSEFTTITKGASENLESEVGSEFTFALSTTGRFVVYAEATMIEGVPLPLEEEDNVTTSVSTIAIAAAAGAFGVVLIGLAIFFIIRKQKQSGKASDESVAVKIHPEMVHDPIIMEEEFQDAVLVQV
jgi:hypothetical protein